MGNKPHTPVTPDQVKAIQSQLNDLQLIEPDWDNLIPESKRAAEMVATGRGDILIVLPYGTDFGGAQHDDGVTAIAAIDLVRELVADYEDSREDFD